MRHLHNVIFLAGLMGAHSAAVGVAGGAPKIPSKAQVIMPPTLLSTLLSAKKGETNIEISTSSTCRMVDDQKSAEIVLAGENAATGGLEAHDVQGNRMEMARKKPRGKGRLCMIFRLGKRPHCEFTNGFPPKDSITREKPAL